jgi:hypothetical protein
MIQEDRAAGRLMEPGNSHCLKPAACERSGAILNVAEIHPNNGELASAHITAGMFAQDLLCQCFAHERTLLCSIL